MSSAAPARAKKKPAASVSPFERTEACCLNVGHDFFDVTFASTASAFMTTEVRMVCRKCGEVRKIS